MTPLFVAVCENTIYSIDTGKLILINVSKYVAIQMLVCSIQVQPLIGDLNKKTTQWHNPCSNGLMAGQKLNRSTLGLGHSSHIRNLCPSETETVNVINCTETLIITKQMDTGTAFVNDLKRLFKHTDQVCGCDPLIFTLCTCNLQWNTDGNVDTQGKVHSYEK